MQITNLLVILLRLSLLVRETVEVKAFLGSSVRMLSPLGWVVFAFLILDRTMWQEASDPFQQISIRVFVVRRLISPQELDGNRRVRPNHSIRGRALATDPNRMEFRSQGFLPWA